MKKIFISIMLILLPMLYSCRRNEKLNEISVVYFPGYVETTIPISMKNLNMSNISNFDEVIIPEKDFSIIKDIVINHNYEFKRSVCDERLLLRCDTIAVCIGDFNCPIYNNHYLDSAIYLIKKESLYYNYFTEEELRSDPYIKKYGIPNNYIYYAENDETPRKDIVCVLLKPKRKINWK